MQESRIQLDDSTERVIAHYADMVYRLALARSGTKVDAEDIFQEVFLRYVKKQPRFAEEEHRKAWLIRVCSNCASNLWRSPWRKHTQALDESLAVETPERQSLQAELQKLPPQYREVIHLFYYEELSLEEISSILKRKNATVRTQLTRARALLRTYMKEEDYV